MMETILHLVLINIEKNIYLNTKDKTNVTAGDILIKAHAIVAEVYDSPSRKKYWVKLALKYKKTFKS